jgi:small-conductance mechanosensitive channel
VGEDQFLKILFKITDPSGNIEDYNASDDTYTLNATQVGSYSIFAYALQLGECFNENQCPSVMMTVNAVKTMPTPAPTQSAATFEYNRINNKLNSLRNQLLTFAESMDTIQSQLTSMKNLNKNVNTILQNTDSINKALQSAAENTSAQPNVGNQAPNAESELQEGGNKPRTRRNKLKRTSKLRKTRSKV